MVNIVKKQIFGVEPVQIDDGYFYECEFHSSELVYSGGALPSFSKCTFDGVNFSFQSAAGNTLSLLKILYQVGFTEMIDKMLEEIKAANLENVERARLVDE